MKSESLGGRLSDFVSLLLLAVLAGVIVWGIDLLWWEYRGPPDWEIQLPPLVEQYWL